MPSQAAAKRMELSREELRHALAAIEHERWASWQEWVHEVSTLNPDGSVTIPARLVERWSRQIATPYAELSDEEKSSDLNQVDRYWPLIERYIPRAGDA